MRDKRALRSLDNIELSSFDLILIAITNYKIVQKVKLDLESKGAKVAAMRHFYAFCYNCDLLNNAKNFWQSLLNSDFESKEANENIISQALKIEKIAYFTQYFYIKMRHSLHNEAEEIEKQNINYYKKQKPSFPPIALQYSLGRSGTTLSTQWLSTLGFTGFTTNIFAGFADFPILGAKVQKQLFSALNLNFKQDFKSDYGRTDGILNVREHTTRLNWPNSLNIFFKSTLLANEKFAYYENLSEYFLDMIRAYYSAYADIFSAPVSLKTCPYIAIVLEKIFDNTIYIELSRDRYTHTMALASMFKDFWESREEIEEYSNFVADKSIEFDKEPIKFCAIALKNALKLREIVMQRVPENRKIKISYEEFCNNPKDLFLRLKAALKSVGYEIPKEFAKYSGVEKFTISPRVPDENTKAIVDSIWATDKYDIKF